MLVFPVETVWLPGVAPNFPSFLFIQNEVNKAWLGTTANIPAHLTYHLRRKVITREGHGRNEKRTRTGLDAGPRGGRRSGRGLDGHAGRAVLTGEGLPPGGGSAGRPFGGSYSWGSVVRTMRAPFLPSAPGSCGTAHPASDAVRGGSENNERRKRANEKNNPLETQAGALSPFPQDSRRRRYYRDTPPPLPAESPPLPEQPGLAAQRGPWAGGRGDTRGVARPPQTWRGSAARAAAPASCGARPALGLTGPPGTPAAPERGQTDGRTAAAGAGTAAAGAGGGGAAADPLRHNAAGRRRRSPGPPKGARAGAVPRRPNPSRRGGR